jgi:predicted Rossmann fold nucleotide-binding protein DprA/Smf involved in DNA uptake
LRAGAKLVETVEDVLSELPPEDRAGCSLAASATPRCVGILRRLLDGPASADQLAADEGRQVSEIWGDLLDLEIRGMISRGPGGQFCAAVGGAAVQAVATGARVD